MLTNVSSSIFANANSVELQPVVSAEWNQNLFNQPYLTVAGSGTKETLGTPTPTPTTITDSNKHPNFNTKSFTLSSKTGYVSYPLTTAGSLAYKIVTYVKTNSAIPVMVNSYAKGTSSQFGSASVEANSYGWTRIITYMGSSGTGDSITSMTYTLNVNAYSSDTTNAIIYYTDPEIYATTYFDYQYNTLWPTDSVFQGFRPGESYVSTGNTNYSFPSGFRQISTTTLNGLMNNYSTTTYAPISPIIQNPSFTPISLPVPILKNALPNDMAEYKYFVSDPGTYSGSTYFPSISGLYQQNISSNKIIIKFNTLMSTPTVIVSIDGANVGTFSPDSNGVLALYYSGSAWSTTKWTTMPTFASDASITPVVASFKKINIQQTVATTKTAFSSYSSTDAISDLKRMQVVEISPRLEIDLTPFVVQVSVNKSLDSKNNYVPISALNADDTSITLSGIPVLSNGVLIPIFSSQSNRAASVLANMLKKNIKFYINFNLLSYSDPTTSIYTSVANGSGFIPGGVYYSDTWQETDIQDVTVQCYDITRYLQTKPVPDYVANLKSVFDIITNVLDLAGFTDYDYDSLYRVCNDKAMPLDLFYYYCNSKDTTIVDALGQLFLAYQIGAYIDEYGIMKFLSLSDILGSSTSLLTIDDTDVYQGGYSISNKAKPGKISLRYQAPKIKQSPALQNATVPDIKNSPSFIYTTADDVVWQQQSLDSVGFNHLASNLLEKSSTININKNDVLDIFHTFALNNNGYVFIENEIVSFVYKEYRIYKTSLGLSDPNLVLVSVKNDLELSSEVNRFIKKNQVALITSTGATSTDYDVTIELTGNITNVQRGLFGTAPSDHTIIFTNIASKSLSEKTINSSYVLASGTNTSIVNNTAQNSKLPSVSKIAVAASTGLKTIIYPTSSTDAGYKTYGVTFDMPDQNIASGGLFFNMASATSTTGAFYVELFRYTNTSGTYTSKTYRYILAVYNSAGVISWADVTGQCNSIVGNFEKILVNSGTNPATYSTTSDQAFSLKVVHYTSDGTDGEDVGEVVTAFINNVEITGWQVPSSSTSTMATGWNATAKNTLTGLRKKPLLGSTVTAGTVFGYFSAITPVTITGGPTITSTSNSTNPSNLREIYASAKALKERSVSYWYQDREFLNGLVQGNNLFSKYKSYMMQTTPEVSGINYYDVQYTTPAAVNVDILPIEYMWYYFPGTNPNDQQYYQKQLVDEYSLAYSTPINTGFRAKMAIANNSNHMIYLSKQSDQLNQFTINLNLWTHELVAPSDPEVIEYIVDPGNISEVAQIDSEWIQSKEAANKMLVNISRGLDGFSKDITIQMFGNPLIQVGDIITLNYLLVGINQQKYVVHSVSHSFLDGLSTTLVLNMVDKGVSL